MPSSPLLSFLNYQPLGLKIEPDTNFDRSRPQRAQIEATFGVSRHESATQQFLIAFSCRLFRTTAEDNLPYAVEFGLTGEFLAAQKLEPDGIPARAVNNALSLLYGVARGIIGQATAGSVNGRFVLPTVTFDDLVAEAAAKADSQVKGDAEQLIAQGQPPKKRTPRPKTSKSARSKKSR